MYKMSSTILLFLILGGNTFAQNIDENNIYYRALKEYARYVHKFEPEVDTVFFEEVKGITTYFPKEIDGLTVQIITSRNQVSIYESNGGALVHRKMTPAQVVDNKLDIGIIPYQGQYSAAQGGLRLGLAKWHSVIFEFNPQTLKFDYRRIDNN